MYGTTRRVITAVFVLAAFAVSYLIANRLTYFPEEANTKQTQAAAWSNLVLVILLAVMLLSLYFWPD